MESFRNKLKQQYEYQQKQLQLQADKNQLENEKSCQQLFHKLNDKINTNNTTNGCINCIGGNYYTQCESFYNFVKQYNNTSFIRKDDYVNAVQLAYHPDNSKVEFTLYHTHRCDKNDF